MAKLKNYFINIFGYLKSLSLDIKILYGLSSILFIVEYANSIFNDNIYRLPSEFSYIDFSWVYCAVLPLLYIIINIVLISVKRINYISLILMFIMRVLHPSTTPYIIVALLEIYEKIT